MRTDPSFRSKDRSDDPSVLMDLPHRSHVRQHLRATKDEAKVHPNQTEDEGRGAIQNLNQSQTHQTAFRHIPQNPIRRSRHHRIPDHRRHRQSLLQTDRR
jgi:hypothetical protein